MKKKMVTLALACASACLFLAPQAHAQCPTGTTNPLSVLVGKWTFDMDGVVQGGVPYAAAGQFTAFIGAIPGDARVLGRLSVTQSSSDGARQEIDVGTYQVLGDCSGGTLTFTLSQRSLQFDFFFDENFGEIRFVATTPGVAVKGTAERF
jgi:hypothetical protein